MICPLVRELADAGAPVRVPVAVTCRVLKTDSAELRRRGFGNDLDRRARIDAFLNGYGRQEPVDVVHAVLRRQQRAIEEVRWLGERGYEPQATWLRAGWPDRWRSKLDVTDSLREQLDSS